ncbi:MAG: hypothetical protein AAGB51_10840 [Planctomycetota bacterium]
MTNQDASRRLVTVVLDMVESYVEQGKTHEGREARRQASETEAAEFASRLQSAIYSLVNDSVTAHRRAQRKKLWRPASAVIAFVGMSGLVFVATAATSFIDRQATAAGEAAAETYVQTLAKAQIDALLGETRGQVDAIQAQFSNLQTESSETVKRIVQIEADANTAEASLGDLLASLESAELGIREVSGNLSSFAGQIAGLDSQYAAAWSRLEDTITSIDELDEQIGEATGARLATWLERLGSFNDYLSVDDPREALASLVEDVRLLKTGRGFDSIECRELRISGTPGNQPSVLLAATSAGDARFDMFSNGQPGFSLVTRASGENRLSLFQGGVERAALMAGNEAGLVLSDPHGLALASVSANNEQGEFSLYDASGGDEGAPTRSVRLYASDGNGQLRLFHRATREDGVQAQRLVAVGGSINDDGGIWLRNQEGNELVRMVAQGPAGTLSIYNSAGEDRGSPTQAVKLSSGDSGGGSLRLYGRKSSPDGAKAIQIASVGRSINGDGGVWLRSQEGNELVRMIAQEENGILELRNASGEALARLLSGADEGVLSLWRMDRERRTGAQRVLKPLFGN